MNDIDRIGEAIERAKLDHQLCESFDHTEETHITQEVHDALQPIFHSVVHK